MLPLGWLAIVTLTAGWLKIFSDNPKLGFLSHARMLDGFVASGALPPGVKSLEAAQQMIFNDRLDAAVAAFFMISVIVILTDSAREWLSILSGRKRAVSTEVSFSHTRDFAIDATGGG